MRKSIIIGITAAVIGTGTLAAGMAAAGDGWGRCGDRDGGRHGKHEMMGEYGHKGMKQMRYIASELDLTSEQRDQFKELMRDQRDAMFDKRDAMHDMREDLRELDVTAADYDQQVAALTAQAQQQAAELVQMKAEQKKLMFSILTPEQQEKFLEMKR